MEKCWGAVIGITIGMILGLGEIHSQTTWLDDVKITEVTWEPIPSTTVEEDSEQIITRTHDEDIIKEWWMLDHGDDPSIPNDIEEAGIAAGHTYNICPEMLYSVGYEESRYVITAKNGACVGVMQVSQYWHAWRCAELGLRVDDLYDPYVNMMIAAWYLSELCEKYDGDIGPALMEYNGDSEGLSNYWKTGELSDYAAAILERSAEMERRHGK